MDRRDGKTWAVVIPYYNEEDYLGRTLETIAGQDLSPDEVVLVDNASTDGSAAIAKSFADRFTGGEVNLLYEPKPGQAAALARGIAEVESDLTAICDADTIYPPSYLAVADRLFREGGEETVAVIAFGVSAEDGFGHKMTRAKGRIVSALLGKQCHGGGYAQAFRTEVLKKVGGYSQALWPYCLKDHELINRVVKEGRIGYSSEHWCVASDRRTSRTNVRWTLFERIMYHITPAARKDWFFYDFLKSRFEARGLSELRLREREWEQEDTN